MDTIYRELEEETAYSQEDLKHGKMGSSFPGERGKGFTVHPFRFRVHRRVFEPGEEHQEFRWVSPEDPLIDENPGLRKVLENLD